MSYIESSLIPGEKVVQRARHHWIMPFKRTVLLVFWLIVAAVLLLVSKAIGEALGSEGSGDSKTWFTPPHVTMIARIVAGVLALLVVWGYVSFLLWLSSTEYAVTNNRVLMKDGLIRRNTFDVQLHQLETVGVHQGLFGRILGYGTVALSATGGSGRRWVRIADPLHFKKHIEQAAQKRVGGGMSAAPAAMPAAAPGASPGVSPAPEPSAPEPAADGPGSFRVVGVNKETHEDAELLIDAGSAANARVKGELEGLVVTSVERVAESS